MAKVRIHTTGSYSMVAKALENEYSLASLPY